MEKKDRKEIFALFKQAFTDKDFTILSGLNPCIIRYNGVRFNVYIKNLTPAQLSNNNPDVWRCQLPKRPIFDDFKSSSDIFLLLGYDASNDVYATWNPYWAKQRLNIGESVSMYSRYSIQKEASEKNSFIEFDLNHKGIVVVFPRVLLTEYIDNIPNYFAEETTYKAIGSSLRKKDSTETEMNNDNSVIDSVNEGISSDTSTSEPNIATPELIAQIAPLMCKDEPQEMEAMQILFNEFGNSYSDTMQFMDWLNLLRKVNWAKLSGLSVGKPQILDLNEDEAVKQTVLKVTLASGEVIFHKKSIDTYVDTIEHLYPDLISEMNLTLRNAPLVSKERVNERQRELKDGFFLSVCSHTKDLAKVLHTVADELGEPLTIEIVNKDNSTDTDSPTEKARSANSLKNTSQRQTSVGFNVTFPDGTCVHEDKGKLTLIECLKLIGLERIYNDYGKHGVGYAGYCIVDKRKRDKINSKSSYQTLVDGFYVYTHSSHEAKVEHLKILSNFYNLGLVIEWDEEGFKPLPHTKR